MGVAVDAHTAMRGHRCAFGIGQPLVHRQAGGFAGTRHLDGCFRGEIPGVIEVQVGYVARHVGGIGEPGELDRAR